MAELTDIRETVRQRYAEAATAVTRGRYQEARRLEAEAGCCGQDAIACSAADQTSVFGGDLYDQSSRDEVPDTALNASLGCGVPTAVADLRDGEIVLDLGSGAGALTETEFRSILTAAGFDEIEIRPTHQVHQYAASAIIRARKPATADCCDANTQATCCEPAAKAECCSQDHAPGACACASSVSEQTG